MSVRCGLYMHATNSDDKHDAAEFDGSTYLLDKNNAVSAVVTYLVGRDTNWSVDVKEPACVVIVHQWRDHQQSAQCGLAVVWGEQLRSIITIGCSGVSVTALTERQSQQTSNKRPREERAAAEQPLTEQQRLAAEKQAAEDALSAAQAALANALDSDTLAAAQKALAEAEAKAHAAVHAADEAEQQRLEKKKLVLWSMVFSEQVLSKMRLDTVAVYSTTNAKIAQRITQLCCKLLTGLKDPEKATITEACAGIGGNTLFFAQAFGRVNAIELDKGRIQMLRQNLAAAVPDVSCAIVSDGQPAAEKVQLQHKSYCDVCCTLEQDILFLDPPWPGAGIYKHLGRIKADEIKLGDTTLLELCKQIHPKTAFVMLKLPNTFHVDEFRERLVGWKLRSPIRWKGSKMLLLILERAIDPAKDLSKISVGLDYS